MEFCDGNLRILLNEYKVIGLPLELIKKNISTIEWCIKKNARKKLYS